MFSVALLITLILFTAGLLWRFYGFHKRKGLLKIENGEFSDIKTDEGSIAGRNRIFGFREGRTTFGNIFQAIFNVAFQSKLFRASKIRWALHFSLFTGFLFLFVFHALDEMISYPLFPFYEPTLDPFLFLRNLAGTLVLAGGIGIFIRRINTAGIKKLFPVVLILALTGSGFMLEAVKIVSEPVFNEMVRDYSDLEETEELEDLKVFWQARYHVVFEKDVSKTSGNARIDSFALGRELNVEYCIDCHSEPSSAFVSKPLAIGVKKKAVFLNSVRADRVLYHLHYLLAFLILVSFPFSTFFHILLIPITGARKKITNRDVLKKAVLLSPSTLNACTNCGLCSGVCSVYPNFVITRNKNVLPHFKIEAAGKFINTGVFNPEELGGLKQGNDQCTMCYNCTEICPSHIDLQGVWGTLSKTLQIPGNEGEHPAPGAFSRQEWGKPSVKKEGSIKIPARILTYVGKAESYDGCVQCTVCTNVCPIIAYDGQDNDMTPQQIMNLLRLGKRHAAAETRMVLNCLGCYQCQEHCPRELKIADMMIELKEYAFGIN